MPSSHDIAIRKGIDALRRVAGNEAELHRGSISSTVVMWAGNTTLQAVQSGDSITEIPVREWFVRAQDYTLNGHVELPEVGDIIQDGDQYFHALPLVGRGCYEEAGTSYALKIFTKRVAPQ